MIFKYLQYVQFGKNECINYVGDVYNKTVSENTTLSLFCLVLQFCKAMKKDCIYFKFPFQ